MSEFQTSKLVTVFGGSGFIGRHVVRALARQGFRVRAAVRRPDLAGFLQPMGGPGQVQAVQANLRREHRWSVERAVEGADAVVNCTGVARESGRQSFGNVLARGPEMLADVVAKAGIGTLVHVSGIGAAADATSEAARAKAAGDAAVLKACPGAVILQPSVVFGSEDTFFNRLGAVVSMFPVVPLFGGGATKFQPVSVDDVAAAVAAAVMGRAKPSATYELGGPEILSLRDCFERVMAETGHKRPLLPLNFALSGLIASLTSWIPGAPITGDQLELLKTDNVVSAAAIAEGRTLAGLGITPSNLAASLPTYLWRYRTHGQFARSTSA